MCIRDSLQTAEKNDWIEKDSWLNKTDVSFDVFFGDRKVTSRLYDIDVVGYNNGVNKLRLFDIESVDESIVKEGKMCIRDRLHPVRPDVRKRSACTACCPAAR